VGEIAGKFFEIFFGEIFLGKFVEFFFAGGNSERFFGKSFREEFGAILQEKNLAAGREFFVGGESF